MRDGSPRGCRLWAVCFIAPRFPRPEQKGLEQSQPPGEFTTDSEQMPWIEQGQTPPAQLRFHRRSKKLHRDKAAFLLPASITS